MREVSIEEFDTPFRLTLEKAQKAIAGSYFHYARSLLQTLLDHYPNCPALRLMLRQIVVAVHDRPVHDFLSHLHTFLVDCYYCFGHVPLRHLNSLERILNQTPDCLVAHRSFARVAMEKELWGTAALSLEAIATLDPKTTHDKISLARCYLKLGRTEEAQGLIRSVLEKFPEDDFATELLKQASIAETLNKDAWRK